MIIIDVIENVMEYLLIGYRKIRLKGGDLCFCTLPSGTTFDLFLGENGVLKLWSIVGSISNENISKILFSRQTEQMDTGMRLDYGGDISIYMDWKMAADDQNILEKTLRKIFSRFTEILENMSLEEVELLTTDLQ